MAEDIWGRGGRTRCGVSTGASAAAAALAAALLIFRGEIHSVVEVRNPLGTTIIVPVKEVSPRGKGARAVVIKDGGDDPDVTHGLDIVVDLFPRPGDFKIIGGPGVGLVSRPGLKVPVGEPAVNPVPRWMITSSLQKIFPQGTGADIIITVPGGEQVALDTFNPRLGIVGGISILGTTGIVRPMSEEALKDSLVPQIEVAAAGGFKVLVLTPGNAGKKRALELLGASPKIIVEMSNYVGFMLEHCVHNGIREVLLWGHAGKLVKVAAGIFQTHSRVADARREIVAAAAASNGGSRELVQAIMHANTMENMLCLLEPEGLAGIFDILAGRASQRAREYARNKLKVGTVMLSAEGKIMGIDLSARTMVEDMGCQMTKLR